MLNPWFSHDVLGALGSLLDSCCRLWQEKIMLNPWFSHDVLAKISSLVS